jgi:hypothetical protein
MENDSFVRYLDDPDVHDAVIERVIEQDTSLIVHIKAPDGRRFVFAFNGVRSVKKNRVGGMVLYSLSEIEESPPYRRFVFTNWDEEDEAHLEVIAREITSTELQREIAEE